MEDHPRDAGEGAGVGSIHLLLRTERYFAARPRWVVFAVGGALLAPVALADVLTGRDLVFSVFYLVPVALVAWNAGRAAGGLAAGATALVWTATQVRAGELAGPPVALWNALARSAVFLVVASLLATIRGLLERERRAASVQRRAAEDLRELNALKDTLLRAVSHDLKGPIAAVLGSAQTLRRRGSLGLTAEQEASLLEAIEVSARKLDRLVDDLLDLDRLERGLLEPGRVPTDVGRLAEAVVAESGELGPRPVEVISDGTVALLDRGLVERIVDNLVRNAARHTPPGTPVRVTVARTEDPEGVLLTVEDRGPGVPEDLKPSVFEPFRRGSSSAGGAGIGLSLVARFAELHGGRAWVEDRPGGGACFRVLLPGRVVARAGARAAAGAHGGSEGPRAAVGSGPRTGVR
ncbi:MAG TPA: ATP-binding protein [Actinomycetota bacterium]|nr:ATP-binding protein [Actinomycetota bacterium]